jgi:hypothetical protein
MSGARHRSKGNRAEFGRRLFHCNIGGAARDQVRPAVPEPGETPAGIDERRVGGHT